MASPSTKRCRKAPSPASPTAYRLPPKEIIHSWVEVHVNGQWLNLEGFILDQAYLGALQRRFPKAQSFSGFGVATKNLQRPAVEWRGTHTHIQKEGIRQDLGIHADPDQFYAQHGSHLSGIRSWLYQHIVRHGMNRNVARIRRESRPTCCASEPASATTRPPQAHRS